MQATPSPTVMMNTLLELAKPLGLQVLGVSDTQLDAGREHLRNWLKLGMHGDMAYMSEHGLKRLDADTIMPGSIRIVSFRIPYYEGNLTRNTALLQHITQQEKPCISVYAQGRDYHKVIRKQLGTLAKQLNEKIAGFGYRATCDSAPTPEVEIASKAGLGWRGKHTLLIHPKAGSMFFLAELFTNMPLPISVPFTKDHCGTCTQCISICPTQAIVKPYVVDARRCIAYLTIEHKGSIPIELRPLMGTRIYGCDDCQLACPWNKFATQPMWLAFTARAKLKQPDWMELANLNNAEFLALTEGTSIRRIGFERFQRNLAVALGNAKIDDDTTQENLFDVQKVLSVLKTKTQSPMVLEHIEWAVSRLKLC